MKQLLCIICLIAGFNLLSAQKTQTESFSGIQDLKLNTGIGEVQIIPSNSSSVEVKVVYDDSKYRLKFKENGSSLTMGEETIKKFRNGGEISWTVAVPSGTKLDLNSGTGKISLMDVNLDAKVNSGTGKISVMNIEGELDLNSGTGSVNAKECEGAIKMNSGTGSVNLTHVTGAISANSGTGRVSGNEISIEGSSTFNSGTGAVSVILAEKLSSDIALNSGTGSTMLDFNGHSIEGEIIMKCNEKSGSISAPFSFDNERVKDKTLIKTVSKGSASHKVKVATGTGRASIKS